jgi:CRP-like cAMP-binding protein
MTISAITALVMRDTLPVPDAPDLLPGLARSYLFEDLSRGELAPLAATATVRRLGRGESVWQVGDAANEIYVVLEGEVKDCMMDAEGNEVVHFLHGPGMTFGEPGYFAVDHHRIVEVMAVTPAVLIRLDRVHLGPFLDAHPSVKDRALEGLASNTRWQSTMIAALFHHSLIDRVGLRLLELVDSGGEQVDGMPATPQVSQSTLASMIGASRENVNRALATLTAGGYVRRTKGRYLISDALRLRERVGRDWPLAQRRDRRVD